MHVFKRKICSTLLQIKFRSRLRETKKKTIFNSISRIKELRLSPNRICGVFRLAFDGSRRRLRSPRFSRYPHPLFHRLGENFSSRREKRFSPPFAAHYALSLSLSTTPPLLYPSRKAPLDFRGANYLPRVLASAIHSLLSGTAPRIMCRVPVGDTKARFFLRACAESFWEFVNRGNSIRGFSRPEP